MFTKLVHLIMWLFCLCVAGKYHVPVTDFSLRQAHRLWVGAENHTGTANASAVWHARVHPAGDHRLRAHRPRIGHVVRGSDLLRAVSDSLPQCPFGVHLRPVTGVFWILAISRFSSFLGCPVCHRSWATTTPKRSLT